MRALIAISLLVACTKETVLRQQGIARPDEPAEEGEDSAPPPPDSASPDTAVTTETGEPDPPPDTGTPPDPPPAVSCESDLTITFPEGSEIRLDFCERFFVMGSFAFSEDAPPELRAPTVDLHATDPTVGECWIRIYMPSLCGTGFYRMNGTGRNNIEFTADSCPGAPEEYARRFVSGGGYTHIDTVWAGDESGTPTETMIPLRFGGEINVPTPLPPAPEGPEIRGTFRVSALHAPDAAADTDCTVHDGDEDDDGVRSTEFGGTDCDDYADTTFPGAAESESEVDCMTDGDGDGYGSTTPRISDITAGTDCDDDDPEVHPGAADTEGDGTDADCDGAD